MKITIKKALGMALFGSASAAYAAGGAETEGISILSAIFLGFGASIIVFQLFPGAMLFASMVKGLFSAAPKQTVATAGEKGERT